MSPLYGVCSSRFWRGRGDDEALDCCAFSWPFLSLSLKLFYQGSSKYMPSRLMNVSSVSFCPWFKFSGGLGGGVCLIFFQASVQLMFCSSHSFHHTDKFWLSFHQLYCHLSLYYSFSACHLITEILGHIRTWEITYITQLSCLEL